MNQSQKFYKIKQTVTHGYCLLFLSLLFCSESGLTQNLIPNPSFEIYNHCPSHFISSPDKFNNMVGSWNSPNTGTPDYFNRQCLGDASAPFNIAGFALPKHGDAYVGIYVWNYYGSAYREYIEVELKEELKPEQEYKLRFYAMPATKSPYLIDELHVVFSNNITFKRHDKSLPVENYISFPFKYSSLKEIYNWFCFETTIVAKGGEKYIIIGNLKDNKNTNYIEAPIEVSSDTFFIHRAYLLLDNFSLIEVKPDFSF